MAQPKIREILFTPEDLEVLRELRGSRPHRIYSDEVLAFWFDFGERHLAVQFSEFVPLSQNERDEALAIRPCWQEGPFRGEAKVLFENQRIEEIQVIRTLLWFTDHVTFSSREEALAGFDPPRNESSRKIQEVLAKSKGGHEECVTHPRLFDEVEAPVANLVDAGFVAEVRGRELACFCQQNCLIRDSDFVDGLGDEFDLWYARVPLDTAVENLRK